MWNVTRPEFSAKETYEICISKVKNRDLKKRLNVVSSSIVEAAKDYAERAENAELHLVSQSDGVVGLVTTKEMVAVYDGRMAVQRGPGRSIYDKLKALPELGVCPFCDHGPVSTLDHILPKSLYPVLAVTPDNLVGSCKDCNTAKLTAVPTCERDATLHPYFDDISAERWLGASVVEKNVPAVTFHSIPVDSWPDALNARIRKQFRVLGLGLLYASQAAREISGQREDLIRIFDARGADGVREELEHKAETWRAYRLNCWQAATYRALSESPWYCGGGFQRR
ncbi:HNH endonuclease [Pelagibius sp.]|uniref:HNH endonuclease n=1 Tax=Pelagibius sp. TaxID=1931238 RepID=UPI00261A0728|nr:HNH endonuclease signature motif containing protein [Pelagibius sp.]